VSEPPRPAEAVRASLAAGLKQAMKARESVAVETLRSLLSALDNASAVPLPAGHSPYAPTASEAARHDPDFREIEAIFRAERAERAAAAADYADRGLTREAGRLHAQLAVIAAHWPKDARAGD
jgi:uncharacterized protein